jgi:hypothetical protein
MRHFHSRGRGPVARPSARGLACAAALVLAPAVHAQSLVLFDDFSSSSLNPSRWSGEEGRSNGTVRAEARRVISSGQLRIEAKGYGDYTGTSGIGLARNSVVFAKSSAITAMRATVTMRSASMGTCSSNTSPSVARARVFGFFFSAGTPSPGSNFNDVIAGIQLLRAANSTDAAGVMRVQAFVSQCADDNCFATTSLGTRDMGTVATGTPVALQVAWNPSSNNFSFQRDTEAQVTVAYTVADTLPPSMPNKRLEISNQIARCSGSRVAVSASADFDNVMTNSLPAQAASVPSYTPDEGGGAEGG